MEKITKIIKKLDLDCKVIKNRFFGTTVLCFEKKLRKRELGEIMRAFKSKGYSSFCGDSIMHVFRKKKKCVSLK